MKLIVTGYHTLRTTEPEWQQMRDYLLWSGHHHHNVWNLDDKGFCTPGTHEFELETEFLFDNQVNTKCGKRIHDWADYMRPTNRAIRWGHYIENLDELNDLRRQYFKCGYCGHMDQEGGWCPKCRGSEYLTPERYHLLWMRRLTTKPERQEVPSDILASIEKAQKATAERKSAEWIESKKAKLAQQIKDAELEQKFNEMCIRRGLDWQTLQNCIFYGHKQTFCFGWRNKLSKEEAQAIKAKIGRPPMFKVEYETHV